jgi:predicted small secreted protein
MKVKWRTLLLGAAVGLISGYALSKRIKLSPEKVLEQVKTNFKKHSPIQGSWIHMEVEPFLKGQIQYQVYKGGISRTVNGINEQFEFIADASTGTIIEVRPL